MTPADLARAEERRERLYLAVKNAAPETYRRVVEIAHLAHPSFIPDVNKRCAAVEGAIMGLAADLLGVEA